MSFLDRHATGVTIASFLVGVVALSSAASLPSWLRPLADFEEEAPLRALVSTVFSRPDSVPRASQRVAGEGAVDAIAEEDRAAEEETDEVAAEREITPAKQHPTWTPPDRKTFLSWAERLGLEAQPIIIPCLERGASERGGSDCSRGALDRFWSRLAEAEEQRGTAVKIVHYGDSLIASDKITDMVRRRLQERFGSGGKGFMMIKKFNAFQRGYRTGQASGSWRLDVITQRVLRDRFFGYSGASFTAESNGDETVFDRVGPNRFVEIFYLQQKKGGRVEVFADNVLVKTIDTSTLAESPEAMMESVELPDGTSRLKVRAATFGARLFGAVLEAKTPGVVYESIGLPGATSQVWNEPDAHDFERQLGHRDPALVVVMLGGNDGLMLSKQRTTIADIERNLETFIERVQKASVNGDCLVVTPLEAVRQKAGRLIPKPEVLAVIDVQRRTAERRGCAFWDMYASMGGAGSLSKWIAADLMLPDLIHPRNRGSDLLGEMMAEAIMEAYDARPSRRAGTDG